MESMMELKVTFLGGPLDRRLAFISRADRSFMFLYAKDRSVLIYKRENEVLYVHDRAASDLMSADYDAAVEMISALHKSDPPAQVRFEELP